MKNLIPERKKSPLHHTHPHQSTALLLTTRIPITKTKIEPPETATTSSLAFSCTQENLRTALTGIGHIAQRQGSLPILSNVLLRTEGHGIDLVTTNLEVGMTYHLRGKVDAKGVFTTNAKLLADVVQLLPRDRVDAHVRGTELELRCGGSQTKVRGMDAAEFPLIPAIDRHQEAVAGVELLRQALGRVAFATASTDSRPELSGVLWRFSDDHVTLAATDSYRLAEVTFPLIRSTVTKDTAVIIPGRTIHELLRILATPQEDTMVPEATICPTPSQLLAVIGNLECISRLIDGTYPDYTPIIPQSWVTRAVLRRGDLQSVAKAASLFSRTGVHDVHIRFLPKERQCIVRSENAQLGEHQAILDAAIEGDPLEVVLNARYLLEGLAAMATDEVAVECSGSANPVCLRPVGQEGYLYVVMPIKQ